MFSGEAKCLMQQLLRAVAHLHDNWILHRDLKTSNLLLSHRGILKVGKRRQVLNSKRKNIELFLDGLYSKTYDTF